MKKLFSVVLIGMCIVACTGCATIVSDSRYPVTITSSPNEAAIVIKNRSNMPVFSGKTPAVVNLEASDGFFKKASYTITFSKPGFEDSMYTLTSTLDGWYWSNIFLGGILGMVIIDPATGAMWKLDPQVSVELTPVALKGNLCVMDINDIPESWKVHLIKIV